jgi:hypothetical protein
MHPWLPPLVSFFATTRHLTSPEAKNELELIQPGNPQVEVRCLELGRQILVVRPRLVGVGCIVA